MVTNNTITQPIDVRRYDTVVEILVQNPGIGFAEAAQRAGVSESTVRKIWEGTISRPPIIVLERLEKPRRCLECGALCSDWPCVLCEIKRRAPRDASRRDVARFLYKRQKK
jgi:transcriptional regulator with XRE-family HTH domain